MKLSFDFQSYGVSNKGYIRANNEDAWHILPERNFYAIADGMGGPQAGEVAAAMAIDSLCTSVLSHTHPSSIEESCQFLRTAMARANTRVFETALQEKECSGMGTTLSCCLIQQDCLIYAHVGDSRLYRFREQLDQLTEDHSLRNAAAHKTTRPLPPRHIITRAIGASPYIYPDIGVIPLCPDDLFMLCSDGLSDYVAKKTLALHLGSSDSLEEKGGQLVNAALEKGGNDNITLLLIKVSNLPK